MRRTRDSIADIWGERTPHSGEQLWPARVDEQVAEEPDRWVQSCCLLCSNGCGIDIGVKNGKIVGVRGREEDRVNRGRLGPKGLHGWVANNSVDRLTTPLIRNGSKPDGAFREASWDEAMTLIVKKTKEAIKKYTPLSVGFYNTGQFFIEDYYTLSIIAHAGIGTDQMDGNTRLCTATASVALRESFGSDGQPASYSDVDMTDCILLCGHNVANTQTVLWMRMLDRKRGPNPPNLIVIDPRETATAKEANVHLAPKVGTNVAVMNGLLHLMIAAGHVDRDFVEKHTVGFEKLAETVAKYPPSRVREITGIPESKLRMAGEILGTTPTLLSTVLQGFYQSNQATAASVQVNNVNLIRGLIGKPGCGVLQMNGQPTAQNTRETGCDGEYPAFRNWHNRAHMEDLARRWNVDPLVIPHWHEPASAMEIFRHAETGSLKFLWIMATNPAVSLPELHRIRRILARQSLFVVVQDAFMTETAELADVILPAAIWGEKTGTFTNADRTVHISHKAVDPPGEAKADIDILLDYAKRMDFRDKDGAPLVKWTDAEGAFEHWKECSRGWPCDYSAMTNDKLTGGSGIQWPCTAEHPDGTERLYTDHVFRTQADLCESYGHDLNTGAARDVEEYRANDPRGRAILKDADYQSPLEEPDDAYPFFMTTGRVVYHFHTRTKTGRSKELCEAAPDAFVQMNPDDARRLGIAEDELVEVRSRRGTIQAPARIGDIEPGHVFVPFHYGYWDNKDGKPRAANELTLTAWDPISKQPYYKFAAVQVHRLGEGSTGEQATDALGKLKDRASETADKLLGLAHKTRSHVPDYLGLLDDAHAEFVAACESIDSHHFVEKMIRADLNQLAGFSREAREMLVPFIDRYGRKKDREPTKLRKMLVKPRAGAFGLLRDLHSLYLMYSELHVCLMVLEETAEALRDRELLDACKTMREHSELQRRLVSTQIKHRAPHTLVVPQ
jgi:anaerobic selenocysteine-containing dehydrogenase